ncbi:MAG: M48 family metallopeptidase [Burkholderiaceae bacterium]
MDFFEHQEVARRSTRRLILLFALAVTCVVVAVNLVGAALYFVFVVPAGHPWAAAALPNGFFVTNTLVVLGLIGGGTVVEMNALSSGGDAVARMVNARPVDPSTRDLLDRRLLNVVEEMAIASGVPVPRVFVMDEEASINAFAAGHSINDAVIAVTRGTLTRLNRDELQGVIAHEFSHVLNGDMRLNMRLIGVLFGLTMVAMAGRFLLEVAGRSRGGSGRGSGGVLAMLFFAGVALWVLGYIGVFFGRLIKAAVSRQREYLADASAVQFTRNPDGIGGALRKIGGLGAGGTLGTRIENPQAEALSHLFLGAARPAFAAGLFATHPAITERVRRIYGRSVELLPAPEDRVALSLGGLSPADSTPRSPIQFVPAGGAPSAEPAAPRAFANDFSPVAGLVAACASTADGITNAVGTVNPPRSRDFALGDSERATLSALRSAAADGTRSQLLALALLIELDDELRAQQSRVVAEAYGTEALPIVDDYRGRIQQLPPGARQPLVDVAMPALRRLPAEARQRLLRVAHMLVVADGRLSVREFLLYTILKRRLGPAAGHAVPVKFRKIAEVSRQAGLVLSLTAAVRMPERAEHAFNAGALLLPGVDAVFRPGSEIRLDDVSDALDQLNQLAPLEKPRLIKAVTATAFTDDTTNWRAASTLRMVCAALDAPLPPQLVAVEAG